MRRERRLKRADGSERWAVDLEGNRDGGKVLTWIHVAACGCSRQMVLFTCMF